MLKHHLRRSAARVLALLLTLTMLFTSMPLGAFAVGDTGPFLILLNGKSTAVSANLKVAYAETVSLSLSGYSGQTTPEYIWLAGTETPGAEASWHRWSEGAPAEPGTYYLGYDFTGTDGSTFSLYDGSCRFTIEKAQAETPAGPVWVGGSTASWTASAKNTNGTALAAGVVTGYEVALYKNAVLAGRSTVTGTSCDCTSLIQAGGKGLYTFTVQALVGDTTHYAASAVSAPSGNEAAVLVTVAAGEGVASVTPAASSLLIAGNSAHNSLSLTATAAAGRVFAGWSVSPAGAVTFANAAALSTTATLNPAYTGGTDAAVTAATVDTEGPNVTSFTAGTGSEYGLLKGTAADPGSAIARYAFSPVADDAAVPAGDWQTAPANGAGVAISVSADAAVTGTYYFYVQDASGNITRSAAGIRATEVDYSGFYASGTADPAHKDFLVGDSALTLAVPSRPGFVFGGWHLAQDGSDAAITSLSAHSGAAVTVYALWTRSGISIAAQPESYSGTYDGAAHNLSVSAAGTAGDLSYQWYRVVDGAEQLLAGATSATYPVKNVADSGTYFARVTQLLEGTSVSADSSTAAVSITARPLTVTADSKSLVFGAAVPANFFTWQASGFAAGEDVSVLNAGTLSCAYDPADPANCAAGTYPIALSGFAAENYAVAYAPGSLTVAPKDGTGAGMTLSLANDTFVYTGSAIEPGVTVTDGTTTLVQGTDYTVSYADNVNAGTAARATVLFKGNYAGSKDLPFTIRKAAFAPAVLLAGWTYGDTAGTPDLDTNTSGGAVTYWYYAEGKTAADASQTQPSAAGNYYVFAVVAATGNYSEATTAALAFTIAKRTITLTAASGSWEYDGNSHSNASYTRTGTFVGKDGFQRVAVTGSIINVGTAANDVTCTFSSATNPNNYNIVLVPGTLQVTQRALTAPTGAGWDAKAPGTAKWVAVTRDSLTVNYRVQLWRVEAGGRTLVDTQTVSGTSCDFAAAIRADSAANGVAGYSFNVQALPAGGTNQGNYSTGAFCAYTSAIYTGALTVSGGEGVASALAGGAAARILIQNETVTLTATAQTGYSFTGTVWSEASGSISFADAKAASTAATLSNTLTGPVTVSVAAACSDDLPVISGFSAATYDNDSKVRFTFSATDTKAITGWAITTSADTPPDEAQWHDAGSAAALSGQTLDGVTEPGTYSVWVRDNGGNVVCSAANETGTASLDIYRIRFAAGENGTGSMDPILKVENVAVTLPDNAFSRDGFGFRNWNGASGIYTNGGSYGANVSDTLTAEWTDQHFSYTVNYYFMDTAGNYGTAPSSSAQFSGAYGTTVRSSDAALSVTSAGMQLDGTRASSITLTEDGLTLNIYYRRQQYRLTYSWTLPDGSPMTATQTNYYGAAITEAQKPAVENYVFVGWQYNGSSLVPASMPANNLTATGTFLPVSTTYLVHCYEQNIPANAGDPDSYTLAADLEKSVAALQGDTVTVTAAGADDIEGFTPTYVTISSGSPGGSVPAAQTASATGTVSASTASQLHVNYYYKRNTYHLSLNVYDSNLRTHALYTHTQDMLYGQTIDGAAFEAYDQANWPAAPAGTLLADYADWSTGTRPSLMPAGDVGVARDYIRAVEVPYQIEVYYETSTPGTFALQSSLTYYGYEGKQVTVGGTAEATVNYNDFAASVTDFSHYTFSNGNANNVLSAILAGDGSSVLKVYFERQTVSTTITYYYNTGLNESGNATSDVKLATVVKTGKWGTNYTYEPLALFDGSGTPAAWTGGDIVYTAVDTAKAGVFNFKAADYTVNYAGYYVQNGVGHWPSYKFTTADSLTSHAGDSGIFGQSGNYLNIYYIKVDHDKHYTVDVCFNPAGLTKAGDSTNHDLTVELDGSTYKVRLANKADIFVSTWVPSASAADIAAYPALAYTAGSYTYTGALQDGFTAVNVNGNEYYSNSAAPGYLYVPDAENQFYHGNRVSYNFLTDELNPGRLGYASAEDYLAAYKTAHSNSADTNTYDAKNAGAYIYNSGFSPILYGNSRYVFTFRYVDTLSVTYTMGGKSCGEHYYVSGQTVTIGCDNTAAFPAKSGYTIVWYRDSACTDKAVDFTITQSVILYGRYVRSTVWYMVCNYYMLPDGTYVTDPAAAGLTTSAGSETVSFTDGTGATADYTIPVTYYARDGVRVMAVRELPCLSFANVSLDYNAYLAEGFAYDKADSRNVILGYCEAEGITLSSYYFRAEHTLTVNAKNTDVETVTTQTYRTGQSVTLAPPVKTGYAFSRWDLSLWNGTDYSAWAGAPTPAQDGTVTFAMPDADLQAIAVWTPADYTSTFVHYIETAAGVYAADLYAQLSALQISSSVSLLFNGSTYPGSVYLQDGAVIGASAQIGGQRYWFGAADSDGNGGYSVKTRDLIAVSVPVTAVSESTQNVSAYLLDLSAYPMYSFSHADYTHRTDVATLGAAGTFAYGPDAQIKFFYSRADNYTLSLAAATADNGTATGLTLVGGGTYRYGAAVSARASVAAGYSFLGWYLTADTQFANPLSTDPVYSFDLTENLSLVARTRPSAVTAPTITLSGTSSYVYGYDAGRINAINASVAFPTGTDSANKVVSYQWYAVNGGTRTALSGEVSSTYIFPSGKGCGTYSYECDVVISRSDNSRSTVISSDLFTVTVAPADMAATAKNYDGVYDGADHTITVQVQKPAAGAYSIYYAASELTAANYASAGSQDAPVYRDVRLVDGAVGSYTVYYYIHSTDGSYHDLAGSALVTIRPVSVTLRASGSFHKTYDGTTGVSGSVTSAGTLKYELSRGAAFSIVGLLSGEQNLYVADFDAEFDSKDVETAGSLTLRNIRIVSAATGAVNNNYNFGSTYTLVLSGYITPFLLDAAWDEDTVFLYNGAVRAPGLHLNTTAGIPEPAIAGGLAVQGGQINAGSYTAYAVIEPGAGYEPSNYSFSTDSRSFTVSPRPITVTPAVPAANSVVYDGLLHTVDSFVIGGSGLAEVAGNPQTFTARTNQGARRAGTTVITPLDLHVYQSGTDITDNYAVTYVPADFVIARKAVTVSGFTADNKVYDGSTTAVIHTDNLSFTGLAAGDSLAISAAAVSGTFDTSAAGSGKTVTVALEPSDLGGTDAANYLLDVAGSTTATTANITQAVVTVTGADTATVYGKDAVFSSSFSGFVNGENESVLTGSITYTVRPAGGTAAPYTTATSAGTYSIAADLSGLQANNYTLRAAATPATLTVAPRPLAVVSAPTPSVTKVYDGTTAATAYVGADDWQYAAVPGNGDSGLVNGDAPTLRFSAVYDSKDAADTRTVTLSGLTVDNANYALANNTLTLTSGCSITPRALTVTAADKSVVYGAAVPAYSAGFSGFVAGETSAVLGGAAAYACAYDPADAANRHAGSYPITVSGYTSNNYTLSYVPGTLTVSRAVLTVTAAPAAFTYGKPETVPAYTSSYSGFQYGDTAAVVSGTLTTVCIKTSADVQGTYAGAITPVITSLTADNYTFKAVSAALTILRHEITVSGITVNDKVYDGTTAVSSSQIQLGSAVYAGILPEDEAGKGLVVTGTYASAGVGTGITVGLQVALNTYLQNRYYLVTETTQSTAAAGITQRPLTVTAGSRSILYGAAEPAYTAGYSGFAAGESPANLTGTLTFSENYTADSAAGTYSPAGAYPVTPGGYDSNGNYAINYVAGTLTVSAARLAAPNVTWSGTPGLINWTAVSGIGAVAVGGYRAELVDTAANTVVATVNAGAAETSCDFLSAMRAHGAGSYQVRVTALASETNNAGKTNVADSTAALSGTKRAARVLVQFAQDAVSQAAKAASAAPITIQSGASYVMIAGESGAAIAAQLKNATGYTVSSLTANSAALTVTPPALDTAGTALTSAAALSATLASAADITVTLTMAARPATLTLGITADPASVPFGYTAASAPLLTAAVGLESSDNLSGTGDYTYTYQWYLKEGASGVNTAIESATAAAFRFPTGKNAADNRYWVTCEVTATRRDNGMQKTITSQSQLTGKTYCNVIVARAQFSSVVSQADWTYGEARSLPAVSSNPGSATVRYEYNSTSASAQDGWTTAVPKNAGTYYVRADILQSLNYGEFLTPAVAFTIHKNKLATPANLAMSPTAATPYGLLSWDAVTGPQENAGSTPDSTVAVSYRVRLYRAETDSALDADWTSVYDTVTAATSLDVASHIGLSGYYRFTVTALAACSNNAANCDDSDESTRSAGVLDIRSVMGSLALAYEKVYDGTPITLDAELDSAGIRYQWLCNNTEISGATARTLPLTFVEQSGTYTCRFTLADGNVYYSTNRVVTITPLAVTVTSDTQTKIYDGTPLAGAMKTVTTLGTGDTIEYTLPSRTEQGSETNVISAVTIRHNAGAADEKVVFTEGGSTNSCTLTKVTGMLSVTARSLGTGAAFNTGISVSSPADETYDGLAHVPVVTVTDNSIQIGGTGKVLTPGTDYTAAYSSNLHAGTAVITLTGRGNYTGTITRSFTILQRPLTLAAGSSARAYNGSALTNRTCAVAAGTALAAGDNIDASSVACSGSILDLGSVPNSITAVNLLNAGGQNVNADYALTKQDGTLTISAIPANITITANSHSKTYDGSALTDSGYTFTNGVLVAGDSLTAVVAGTQTDAGTSANTVTSYIVRRSSDNADVTRNYTFAASIAGTLTVNPAPASVAIVTPSLNKTYDGLLTAAPLVAKTGDGALTFKYYLITAGGPQELSAAPKDAGSYSVTANTAATRNYTAAVSQPLPFTISPRAITVTAADADSSYGSPLAALSAAVTSTNKVCAGDDLHIGATCSVTPTSPFGTYPILPVYDANPNYTVSAVNGNYLLHIGGIPCAATGYLGDYDGAAHSITVTGPQTMTIVYSESALDSGNYRTLGGPLPSYTDAGTYRVYYYATAANYNDVSGSAEVVIRPAAQTILTQSVTAVYDGAAHSVLASASSGGAVSYDNNSRITAGTTTVNIHAAGSANFLAADVTATITITRRSLTVTAGSDTKPYDGTPLSCSDYSVTAGSLAAGDTIADVSMKGSLTEAGTTNNSILSLVIRNRAGQDVTDCYDITRIGGTLRVTPAASAGTPAPDVPDQPNEGSGSYPVGAGKIILTVEAKDAEGDRVGGSVGSSRAVVSATATQPEMDAVAGGGTLEIRLNATLRPTPSAQDGALRGTIAGTGETKDLQTGALLDLQLEKRLGDAEWQQLQELGTEITVTVEIPEAYRVQGAKYYVASPDGSGYQLLEDLDNNSSTITFRTRLFSSCKLVYEVAAQGSCFVIFNLVATILSLLFAVVSLLKKKELRVPAAAVSLVGLIAYILLFTTGRPILFNRWSLFFAAVLLAEIFFRLRRERKKDTEPAE